VNFCWLLIFIIIYLNSLSILAITVGREVQSWYFSGASKGFFTPAHFISIALLVFQIGAIAYAFYAYREFKAYMREGGGLNIGGAFPMPGGQPVGRSAREDDEAEGAFAFHEKFSSPKNKKIRQSSCFLIFMTRSVLELIIDSFITSFFEFFT
jgi:hypothetical protein